MTCVSCAFFFRNSPQLPNIKENKPCRDSARAQLD